MARLSSCFDSSRTYCRLLKLLGSGGFLAFLQSGVIAEFDQVKGEETLTIAQTCTCRASMLLVLCRIRFSPALLCPRRPQFTWIALARRFHQTNHYGDCQGRRLPLLEP